MSPDHALLAFVFLAISSLMLIEDGDPTQREVVASKIRTLGEPQEACRDHHASCQRWANLGFCAKNHTRMLPGCPVSCDACDDVDWNDKRSGCPRKYPACQQCRDLKAPSECARWKRSGACANNPGFMVIHCAQTCQFCHLRDSEELRCPNDERWSNETQLLSQPGDLDAIFEAIVATYAAQREQLSWSLEVLSRDPWLLRFENFLSAREAQGIVDAAKGSFRQSVVRGGRDAKGREQTRAPTQGRTSRNAWCTQAENERCWRAPSVQSAVRRMESVLNVSAMYSEHLQVLEYTAGQFYREHHDFIATHLERPCGPRILTWFMYLSDVTEGGATRFRKLDIESEPKVGRAILWPQVLDADPTQADRRTVHEALPVVEGVKYAANAWFHLKDFQTPIMWACGPHSPLNKK